MQNNQHYGREQKDRKSLYKTKAWHRIRWHQLQQHPLCAYCLKMGMTTPATIVDHIEPHRGDSVKFFAGPFQSLCKQHHDSAKQREEKRGMAQGCGADGVPLDSGHWWWNS